MEFNIITIHKIFFDKYASIIADITKDEQNNKIL